MFKVTLFMNAILIIISQVSSTDSQRTLSIPLYPADRNPAPGPADLTDEESQMIASRVADEVRRKDVKINELENDMMDLIISMNRLRADLDQERENSRVLQDQLDAANPNDQKENQYQNLFYLALAGDAFFGIIAIIMMIKCCCDRHNPDNKKMRKDRLSHVIDLHETQFKSGQALS